MKRITPEFVILAAILIGLAGCGSDKPTAADNERAETSPSFDLLGDGCIDPSLAASIGLAARDALSSETYLARDLWLPQQPSLQLWSCRVYVKWHEGSSTYQWDDYFGELNQPTYATCNPICCEPLGYILPTEYHVYHMNERRTALNLVLQYPETYNADCGIFENPFNGEVRYTVTFDDPVTTVRRTVVITVK